MKAHHAIILCLIKINLIVRGCPLMVNVRIVRVKMLTQEELLIK